MSIFKRLSATFVSQLDQVVGEIENHDAVVQATLSEQGRKVAKAKVRLARLRRDEAKQQEQLQSMQEEEFRWAERAIESAKSDEAKALECIRRRQQCRNQAARMVQSLEQYRTTIEKLNSEISDCEVQLREMAQKHNLMQARLSSAEARTAVSHHGDDSLQQVEDVFDRWEIQISQQEMLSDDADPMDSLECEFIQKENEAVLRNELTALLTEEKSDEC